MIKKILFLVTLILSPLSHPHVHGHLKMYLAFEGKKGLLNIKGSSEALFGFEHQAKSEKDINKQQEVITKLSDILQYISIDKSFGCKAEMKKHGWLKTEKSDHADYEINYDLNCEKDISKTQINIDFSKILVQLKEIDFQFISDHFQTGKEFEGQTGQLEVK